MLLQDCEEEEVVLRAGRFHTSLSKKWRLIGREKARKCQLSTYWQGYGFFYRDAINANMRVSITSIPNLAPCRPRRLSLFPVLSNSDALTSTILDPCPPILPLPIPQTRLLPLVFLESEIYLFPLAVPTGPSRFPH